MKTFARFFIALSLIFLSACTLGARPTLPTPTIAAPTMPVQPAVPTATAALPAPSDTPAVVTATAAQPTATEPATQAAATEPPTAVPPTAEPATATSESQPEATATSESSVSASASTYGVVLVKQGETLPVYKEASPASDILVKLPFDAVDIKLTGNDAQVGKERWVEIVTAVGEKGWVNAKNLTEIMPRTQFCFDDQVGKLITSFKQALDKKDGKAFASLVNDAHGLTVQYIRGGTVVNYTPEQVEWLFVTLYNMDWGLGAGSGLPVKGSWHEVVLPKLLDVLDANYTPQCNTLQMGGATYNFAWPAEYKNINFYSLYRRAPAGQEQDWRTWLVGVEYVGEKPYLFNLIHLQWEP